ncbi:hypothetical protein [Lactiplantibacillus argentoratensis]
MLTNLRRGIKALFLIGLVLFGWRNYDTLARARRRYIRRVVKT